METSAFKDWFNRKYNDWVQAQPGEEDFLAFCDLLGCTPAKVNEWLDGVSVPEGPELLSIAEEFGMEVYEMLGQDEPDIELLDIYSSFPHLTSKDRYNLAQAIWEAENKLRKRNISAKAPEAKDVILNILNKWGF